MRFVERDEHGNVIAEYARPQKGRAEERLAEDHPDVVAFRNRPQPPAEPTPAEIWRIGKSRGLWSEEDRSG